MVAWHPEQFRQTKNRLYYLTLPFDFRGRGTPSLSVNYPRISGVSGDCADTLTEGGREIPQSVNYLLMSVVSRDSVILWQSGVGELCHYLDYPEFPEYPGILQILWQRVVGELCHLSIGRYLEDPGILRILSGGRGTQPIRGCPEYLIPRINKNGRGTPPSVDYCGCPKYLGIPQILWQRRSQWLNLSYFKLKIDTHQD